MGINDTKWIHFFRQIIVCLIGCNYYFMTGLCMGSPTVVIPQLRKEANSTTAVSTEMASWIPSSMAYSGTVWVLLLTFMGHYLGRKRTLMIQSINSLVAFTVLYFSKNALHIFICQVMHGMTIAAQTTTVMMIISEYSLAKYRGIFLTMKTATMYWGIWTANAIGIFTHYKYIGLVGILCAVFNFIVSLPIPESPYWLAVKIRYEDCAIAHRWLKGANESSEKELDILICNQREKKKITKSKLSLWSYVRYYATITKEPVIYKPLAISMLLAVFYLLSGKLVCAVYAIEIMKKICKNESTAHMGVLILDGFSILGMYIGSVLCRFLKRRVLLLVSTAIGIIFLYLTSLFLFLIRFFIITNNPYISIGLLVVYSLAMCCGPALLTSPITSELLPIRARGFSVCVYAIAYKLFVGTTLKVFPYFFKKFGFDVTFLFFGVCSTVCFGLVFKHLPETKDKTLHEIEALFKSKEVKDTVALHLLDDSKKATNSLLN